MSTRALRRIFLRLPRGTPDSREVARFLRVQSPLPVPERRRAERLPGLIGLSVLGYRVIRPNEGGR